MTERSAEAVKGRSYLRMLMQNEALLNAEFAKSMICFLALAAVICLFVYFHFRHKRKNEETAREIMENCEEEERRNSRKSGF